VRNERPRYEVADVVRLHGEDYRRAYAASAAKERVLKNIAACRTEVLGGHVDVCDSCATTRISYNSCRDRHCPKCQAPKRAKWLAERLQRLLPVPYFHVVFSLPEELNGLALGNKKRIYAILFEAASETLLELSRNEKRLGAQIGVTAVLHTWGQNLELHPHLHCVVTGGGLSADGTRWVRGRDDYFLPVKVMSRLFRGKFMAALDAARIKGQLDWGGSTAELSGPSRWAAWRDALYRKEWVVYAKPPFGGPEQVFRYLGNYTHRVAISNHRIVSVGNGKVSFSVKDYKDDARKKILTLDAVEFLRRFLLHVLPKGLVRIRHYGLCSSSNATSKLALARRLLQRHSPAPPPPPPTSPRLSWWERFRALTGIDMMACPCGGRLHRVERLAPLQQRTHAARAPPLLKAA
jgi:hypothetical protein